MSYEVKAPSGKQMGHTEEATDRQLEEVRLDYADRARRYSERRVAFEADRLASGKDQQENWARKMFGERVSTGRIFRLADGREVEVISREKWEKV